MNEKHNWDEILIDLLSEYEEREIEKIQLEQKDTKISPALDSSIRSLIQQRKKRKKLWEQNHFLKAASILLAFISISALAYFATPKSDAKVENIIIREHSGYITYRFGTKPVEVNKGDYSLGYIPEGFVLEKEEDIFSTHREIYFSEDGRAIMFLYESAHNGGFAEFTEKIVHEDFELNGMEGKQIYAKDGELPHSTVFVLDGDVFVGIFAHLDKEEVIKMLESAFENRK